MRRQRTYLREVLKLPVYDAGGFPIGFDQTEKFVKEVFGAAYIQTAARHWPILKKRERGHFIIWPAIWGQAGFPEELRYAAEGESSRAVRVCGLSFQVILESARKQCGNFLQKAVETVERGCTEC